MAGGDVRIGPIIDQPNYRLNNYPVLLTSQSEQLAYLGRTIDQPIWMARTIRLPY